jgi:hypothetical protein
MEGVGKQARDFRGAPQGTWFRSSVDRIVVRDGHPFRVTIHLDLTRSQGAARLPIPLRQDIVLTYGARHNIC